MTWIAFLTGVLGFTVLTALAGSARRRPRDAGSWALQLLGGAGLCALAAAALWQGAFLAGALAGCAGAALAVDPLGAARLTVRRLRRASPASAVAPFRNAT